MEKEVHRVKNDRRSVTVEPAFGLRKFLPQAISVNRYWSSFFIKTNRGEEEIIIFFNHRKQHAKVEILRI